jgi:nitrile hydratase accessory protein
MPPAPGRDGPAFTEPWQAEAFALAVALNQKGAFAWREWVAQFATQGATRTGGEGDAYFERWLAALEELVVAHGLLRAPEIERRVAQWRRAYLNTPHGQPVELADGLEPASPPGDTSGREPSRDNDDHVLIDAAFSPAARARPVAIHSPAAARAASLLPDI